MSEKKLNVLRHVNKDSAIIFVHGFLGDPDITWGKFPQLIQNDFLLKNWDLYSLGYSTSILPDLRGIWSSDGSINDLAILLKTEIETSPLKKYKNIVLIAHSMGGLIAQKAITESDMLKDKLKHFIMFGTPSNGIKKSIPLYWMKKQLQDLCKGSSFITELRENWKSNIEGKYGFELCVCAGDRDQFVPSSSSLTPFDKNLRYIISGNHLEIVKPESIDALSYRLVCEKLIGDSEDKYPYNLGNVFCELYQFEKVINQFKGTEDKLDEKSLVSYSLALDTLGHRDEAIEILTNHNKGRTDALGTLAGRHKRIWLNEGIEEHAVKAYELYEKAFQVSSFENNKEQMYYHKINLAFLEKVYFNNTAKAKGSAQDVLELCIDLDQHLWELATIAEAYLHLDPNKAIRYYQQLISEKPKPWQIISIFNQADVLCDAYKVPHISDELYTIFTGPSKQE